ncbi:hypothetical protein JQU17_19430 [Ponticoccus sp. SC2-23]|uniref:hypothetical protein n=1 Tax=Alexandriicola marinus TaxID=2081710 RepID=UPI000FD8BB6B|nr:hypothetical protein [Alexandriicola marinus]MBM1220696.1 hypothetical protein [Ponticoccus sp. SC6-9]MBM1225955.1 hypothetical protein [Ponticoccus sp. SC6-15]MBM1231252.1 hypothetical protein [Ponticoccus sp. SC6-38]MBM1235887.1 hypothetical protein [Ponticoccus sp. SC6-45]MBM1240275.1 hypothetical protein [Ponticoccus sp. SC6-49]MBM1244810.1 hypothetical protein [Ponticoccus sp. SC2-64]MBM1249361.1 hypothetical protein [Ponticoccus sp. SC6-42]MBM1252351.1 hypothetical protein [Pontico
MKRVIAAAALASLVAGPGLAEGMQPEREVPQRVIEETAGSSSQHLVLPGIVGAGLFFVYLVVSK